LLFTYALPKETSGALLVLLTYDHLTAFTTAKINYDDGVIKEICKIT
jgi:hypothetical protein